MSSDSVPSTLVWSLGMFSSGSTWLYNTARDVAAALYPGAKITGAYADSMNGLTKLPASLTIVKTHQLPADAAALLDKRARRILLSLRDPRDAVASMMQHMRHPFDHALFWVQNSADFCARYAGDSRTDLFIYEQGFTEDAATLDRLASALGGTLTEPARAGLYTQTRRGAIEEKIARLDELPTVYHGADGDVLDTDTQWHRHHSGRTGEVGRWRRMLTAAQVSTVEQHLADFMLNFGYQREA